MIYIHIGALSVCLLAIYACIRAMIAILDGARSDGDWPPWMRRRVMNTKPWLGQGSREVASDVPNTGVPRLLGLACAHCGDELDPENATYVSYVGNVHIDCADAARTTYAKAEMNR